MQKKAITVSELYARFASGEDLSSLGPVFLEGWIRTNRDSGSIGFIALNDGTCFKNIQIVYNGNLPNHDVVSHLLTGASISISGTLVLTPEMKQPFEIHAEEVCVLGDVASDYPLQKKRHSFEYLREEA